ncbi:MAG: glycerol-3-phosphate acyltransferase [Bacteroidales bacterium]|nr:glycerol-3-phosphate acyltransferase [Bacteroidales bacterium]
MSAVFLLGAYLVGSVPFGYLLGRMRGINLFEAGSGNIGATNVGRVLGWRFGGLCFVLDFLKGAVPVAVVGWAGGAEAIRVGAAAAAFVGHLFPISLGFRGGKGVATGAGTIAVLVPGPATVAILTWLLFAVTFRYVSLASILAVVALGVTRLLTVSAPLTGEAIFATGYCLLGGGLVAVKHRGNIRRLFSGTESRLGERAMRQDCVKGLYVLAAGLWFGGSAFFNFGTALPIFASFKEVVNAGPSDRTAYVRLLPEDAPDETKAALASALAGSAVGPVFPRYFAMQAVCGVIALVTALSWWNVVPRRGLHRGRVVLVAVGLIVVAVGWPISEQVSALRLTRFDPDPTIAAAAKEAFGSTHLISLSLSLVNVLVSGVALFLGGMLPATVPPSAQPASAPQPVTAS